MNATSPSWAARLAQLPRRVWQLLSRGAVDAARAAEESRKAAKTGASVLKRTDGVSRQVDALGADIRTLRAELREVRRELRERLLQYHLQLGRLAGAVESTGGGTSAEGERRLSGRTIPLDGGAPAEPEWDSVGDGVAHPDPAGREWAALDACPACGHADRTVVSPWNKLILLKKAPDATSARYDYAVCHACGVLHATRRPFGERYKFLLAHFGEVTAKRGEDGEIGNRVLNPYPLSDADRDELRRLAARGVFVSDHLGLRSTEYLAGMLRDRFENSAHVDLLGVLLSPRKARVLEIRSRAGTILDGLRRYFAAEVFAMPIWESQQFLLREMYGIETSGLVDFDRFSIPFDGSFDLIICNHMFTHVLRPRDFFAALRARLAPGGHIYLHNEPDDAEFLAGKQSMLATLNPLHMQAFDQRSLMRALAANGFETVFIKRRNLDHLCLARLSPDARLAPMGPGDRQRRIAAYQRAYDRAVLGVDEHLRPRMAAEWSRAVERGVAAGIVEFDDTGRLRLVAR